MRLTRCTRDYFIALTSTITDRRFRRHGRVRRQQRWLSTRVQEHAWIVRVHVQQRVHVTREQTRLQGRRLQARDLGAARGDQQPQLPGLVPRPERLRLAFHHHSGSQDQSGNGLFTINHISHVYGPSNRRNNDNTIVVGH